MADIKPGMFSATDGLWKQRCVKKDYERGGVGGGVGGSLGRGGGAVAKHGCEAWRHCVGEPKTISRLTIVEHENQLTPPVLLPPFCPSFSFPSFPPHTPLFLSFSLLFLRYIGKSWNFNLLPSQMKLAKVVMPAATPVKWVNSHSTYQAGQDRGSLAAFGRQLGVQKDSQLAKSNHSLERNPAKGSQSDLLAFFGKELGEQKKEKEKAKKEGEKEGEKEKEKEPEPEPVLRGRSRPSK